MFPEALKQFKRWIGWIIEEQDGRLTKSPRRIDGQGYASCDDPSTWTDYATAAAAVKDGKFSSIGFVLGKEVGLVIVDFDKVIEHPGDPLPQWVRGEIEELDTYTEISASGRGLHSLVWGAIPSNLNRQQLHIEIHDSNKMFALSGNIFEGRDQIESRDLSVLHSRIANGKIGPEHKGIIAERWDTQKFRDVCADEWAKHGLDSRSAAVQSALVTLAVCHGSDPEKMREEFEKTLLCEAWGSKWDRLANHEIAVAIKFVSDNKITEKKLRGVSTLDLDLEGAPRQRVRGHYVMSPKDSKFDGWFRIGSISIVAGPSGAGKTTLVFDLLQEQSEGKDYLGHKASSLPFLVLFADRTYEEMLDTIERMELPESFPAQELDLSWGATAVIAIHDAIKKAGIPKAVFVEGADELVEDASKVAHVAAFLKPLQKIATHYQIAIILSTGAPKSSPQGVHKFVRDRIFGSQIWPRMAGTCVSMTFVDDGTEKQRTMIVQHRNAGTEKFNLVFAGGKLVVDSTPRPSKQEQADARKHEAVHSFNGEWFTRPAFEERAGLSKAAACEWLDAQYKKKVLKRKAQGKGYVYQSPAAIEVLNDEGVELGERD